MYINDNNKKTYQAIILLNELVNGDHKFQTVANGDDKVLETLFIELMAKGYVQTSGMYYVITAKGQEASTWKKASSLSRATLILTATRNGTALRTTNVLTTCVSQ
jgi:hypothetical protein